MVWSESDIASKCVRTESNLMFTLNSDKDYRKKNSFAFSFALSFSVNEPLRKRISLSASKTGNYEKECKKETVTFELCCLP